MSPYWLLLIVPAAAYLTSKADAVFRYNFAEFVEEYVFRIKK